MSKRKIFYFFLIFFFLNNLSCQAAVSGTSTPLSTFPNNKVKENSLFAPIRIELAPSATDTLVSVDLLISTTTNASPIPLTSNSFNWIGLASSSDSQFDNSDQILATTTLNIGTTTTINLPPGIPAGGFFLL